MSDLSVKNNLQEQQENEINRINNIIKEKEKQGFEVKQSIKDKLKISKIGASSKQMEKRLKDLQSIGKKDINKNIKAFYYYDEDGNKKRLKVKRGKSVFNAGIRKLKELKEKAEIVWDGVVEITNLMQVDYLMERLRDSYVILNPKQHNHGALDYGKFKAWSISTNLHELYREYRKQRISNNISEKFVKSVLTVLSGYNFESSQIQELNITLDILYEALTGSTEGFTYTGYEDDNLSTIGTPYEEDNDE